VNFLRALAALLVTVALAHAKNWPILIDLDVGSDDFMAVALLLAHPTSQFDPLLVVNGTAHWMRAPQHGRLLDLAAAE